MCQMMGNNPSEVFFRGWRHCGPLRPSEEKEEEHLTEEQKPINTLLKMYIHDLGLLSLNDLKEACQKTPRLEAHSAIKLLYALLYLAAGKTQAAASYMTFSSEITGPNAPLYRFCLGLFHAKIKSGNSANFADNHFASFLQKTRSDMKFAYGQVYYHLKSWDLAITYLSSALMYNSQNIYALIMRGKAYHYNKKQAIDDISMKYMRKEFEHDELLKQQRRPFYGPKIDEELLEKTKASEKLLAKSNRETIRKKNRLTETGPTQNYELAIKDFDMTIHQKPDLTAREWADLYLFYGRALNNKRPAKLKEAINNYYTIEQFNTMSMQQFTLK